MPEVRQADRVTLPFPEPTNPMVSAADVFTGYLDFFRSRILAGVEGLPASEISTSRLPSGWTPLQLVKHLTYVERRWLEWGFEGKEVAEPWGDSVDDRWYVAPDETASAVTAALRTQGEHTRAVVQSHAFAEIGQPGPRWDGADPPTLERILLHLLQEYARHLGQLDIVVELATGRVGE
jgi:uncharacterized damage-inducible protein DinB